MDNLLTIQEISRRSGVAASALRFYETRGLIKSERSGAGHRRFPRAVLRRIAFIVFAQKVGLSLPETEGNGDDERRDAGLREALLKAHELAAAYFREQLASPSGARARQQLKARDVSPKTIETLQFGDAFVDA